VLTSGGAWKNPGLIDGNDQYYHYTINALLENKGRPCHKERGGCLSRWGAWGVTPTVQTPDIGLGSFSSPLSQMKAPGPDNTLNRCCLVGCLQNDGGGFQAKGIEISSLAGFDGVQPQRRDLWLQLASHPSPQTTKVVQQWPTCCLDQSCIQSSRSVVALLHAYFGRSGGGGSDRARFGPHAMHVGWGRYARGTQLEYSLNVLVHKHTPHPSFHCMPV
jgi:hypothetical protein